MTQESVLVVGGGIGGLSTAIALRQKGFDVTVIEKQSDVHSSVYGVGIIQPANALRALDAIGLADACIDAGYPAKAWGAMYDQAGNHLKDMPGVTPVGYETLPPMNGLTRPILHQLLTDRAIAVGTEIRYATTFEALAPVAESAVDVTFADGTTERFGLVIGADGVRSQVRPYVLDEDLAPEYIGQSAYRQNIPMIEGIDRIILQTGENGMAGYVPIGKDLAYLFINVEMERGARPAKEDLATTLRDLLAPYGGITEQVLPHIDDPEKVVLRPEEALIAPAPWHRGRIALIGDAVHAITPHLGQGAAQAIEDGVVIAECLAAHDDVDRAFTEYAERRHERCRLIVETSLNIAKWEMGELEGFDNIAATNEVLEVMARPL